MFSLVNILSTMYLLRSIASNPTPPYPSPPRTDKLDAQIESNMGEVDKDEDGGGGGGPFFDVKVFVIIVLAFALFVAGVYLSVLVWGPRSDVVEMVQDYRNVRSYVTSVTNMLE